MFIKMVHHESVGAEGLAGLLAINRQSSQKVVHGEVGTAKRVSHWTSKYLQR